MTDEEIAEFFQTHVRICARCDAPFRLGARRKFCSAPCAAERVRERQHAYQVKALRRIRATVTAKQLRGTAGCTPAQRAGGSAFGASAQFHST